MVETVVKEIMLRGNETAEAIAINRPGRLLGIRCRSEGLSDYSRFVRLIMYADCICLVRRLLSDPKSVPALHMDHVSGTDTPHWAVEAGLIRPPWFSPLGRWGVLQHDKRHAKWDYFAYNTPSTEISFTEKFEILLHNPSDEIVKFKLKILIDNLKNNHVLTPSLHVLYHSYGIVMNPGETIHIGYIEGPGDIDCFWIHIKLDKNLIFKDRVLGAFHRKLKLPFKSLLDLLDKIILGFSKEDFSFTVSLRSLNIVDLASIINKLQEYYGSVLLPPDRMDLFISIPILTLPPGNIEITLKNTSRYKLKIWFNLWVKKALKQ